MGKTSLTRAIRFLGVAGGAALLTACATVKPDPVETPRGPETIPPVTEQCAADAYQHFVGQRIGEIHTDSLPTPLRIYSTTDMVTMDYRVERMNIVTTPEGVVIEVKCG